MSDVFITSSLHIDEFRPYVCKTVAAHVPVIEVRFAVGTKLLGSAHGETRLVLQWSEIGPPLQHLYAMA